MKKLSQNIYQDGKGDVFIAIDKLIEGKSQKQYDKLASGLNYDERGNPYFEYFNEDYADLYATWLRRTLDKIGDTKLFMAIKDTQLIQAGAQFQNWTKEQTAEIGQKSAELSSQFRNWTKEQADKVAEVKLFQKFKTATLSPIRVSFLGLLELNALGYASDLLEAKKTNPAKYKKARDTWYKLGGNRTNFDKVVESGGKKKAIAGFLRTGADGYTEDVYATGVEEILAMIVQAATAIGAIGQAVGGFKNKEADATVNAKIDAALKAKVTDDVAIPGDAPENDSDLTIFDKIPTWAWWTIGIVALGALATTIYLVVKKKK